MSLPSHARLPYRGSAYAAIASGVIGIISVASLVVYLASQATEFAESGVMPPLGKVLLTTNYAGVMLQALLMIPVALTVHAIGAQRSFRLSRIAVTIGVIALAVVAFLRLLLLLSPAVSDILFMGPMGFVGAWLIVVNWLLAGTLTGALRATGMVAGIGLVILGASFFFLGGLVVLTDGPFAYADDADFHVGIAIGGVPGLIVYPIWAILLGRTLLRGRLLDAVA